MPNLGHILIPAPNFSERFFWQEYDEKYPATVWRKPRNREKPKPKGRCLEIRNETVTLPNGSQKEFVPMQVAMMALPDAVKGDFDSIRIKTPRFEHKHGTKAQADVTYKTKDLVEMVRRMRMDSFVVGEGREKNGVVKMEKDGPGPAGFKLTEAGVWAPAY